MGLPLHRIGLASACPFLILLAVSSTSYARESHPLAFEDRVRAQRAIERVYFSNQIRARQTFEEAVPRELLERRVREYLRKSVALRAFWEIPVTAESLARELERIERHTRYPERLRQIYAALDDDTALILECFVRPVLVDRLVRNFFANDDRIHGDARAEIEDLRRMLDTGDLDMTEAHPRLMIQAIRRSAQASPEGGDGRPAVNRGGGRPATDPGEELSESEWRDWRKRAPDGVGDIGSVREERRFFEIRAVLSESSSSARVGVWTVPKRPWENWWSEMAGRLDDDPSLQAEIAGVAAVEGTNLTLLTAGAESASCLPDDTWDNGILGQVPDARVDHTAVWTGSVMIVWGGRIGTIFLRSGGRYDPLTDTWTPTSMANAPDEREDHTAVWTGSEMIVWGGHGGPQGRTIHSTGRRYDPLSDTWRSARSGGAPSARYDHTAVWTGSEMLIWGGYEGTTVIGTGGRYDPSSDSWSSISTSGAPGGRRAHGSVWADSRMIVWGGTDDTISFGDGARYDPVSNSWSQVSVTGAPEERSHHTAVWTGSEVIIWGGANPTTGRLASGGRYDPVIDTWTETSMVNSPQARNFHEAVWTGSELFVWGGRDSGSALTSTGGLYDPVADSWSTPTTANVPAPRWDHTIVWTGDLAIVWGGSLGGDLRTGGRYDPAADTWTPTQDMDAPAGRSYHSAVWTGTEMLIWGGSTSGPRPCCVLSSGSRYDPMADSWTEMTISGAPEARVFHEAVWTGSEMVVWGGARDIYDPSTFFQTGGRYDPWNDAWQPVSTVDAPEPRLLYTTVWTGSEMIVWGGTQDYNFLSLDTGGRYDPGSDSWTPTSTVGAPDARIDHSAVWTGNEMIIWGGWETPSGGFTYDTGARYDPGTDIWTPTATFKAPEKRRVHTAVWSGAEMIVWGGDAFGDSYAHTGGRYDPAADSWSPTANPGAPTGRQGHSAVWTGNEMIVFGGSHLVSVGPNTVTPITLDSGGRYDPVTNRWTATSRDQVPVARSDHPAVWTGSLMIVWGGRNYDTGGRYSMGHAVDNDGDGFSECSGDCNDEAPGIFPGAAELCDGLDNNCDTAVDNGFQDFDADLLADCVDLDDDNDGVADVADCAPLNADASDVPSEVAVLDISHLGSTELSWPMQSIGNLALYDVTTGGFSQPGSLSYTAGTCLTTVENQGSATDSRSDPVIGSVFYYLVKARNDCAAGTFGSQLRDTSPACP